MESLHQMLTIQEVSHRSNVTKHTLRFWEKELEGVLVPHRTKGGQRRYTSKHLFLIEEIKRLKKNGMSLPAIRRKLDHGYNDSSGNPNSHKIDHLADQIAEMVRSTLYRFLETEKLD